MCEEVDLDVCTSCGAEVDADNLVYCDNCSELVCPDCEFSKDSLVLCYDCTD
jgi:hypothetical protein